MNATIRENAMRTETEVTMARNTLARLAGAVLLLVATACGGALPPAAGEQAAPAPKLAEEQLSTGLACTGTDAHTKHLNTFACDVCHEANGGRFLFTKVFTFPGGTSTAGGTITRGSGTTPTSCNVACHAPLGSAPRTVTWDTPGPLACTACHDTSALPSGHKVVAASSTRADCNACHLTGAHLDGVAQITAHDPSWASSTSAGFHALEANKGLTSCKDCHGPALAGQGSVPGCASCHGQNLPQGVASWDRNCTMCHGGTDNQTGAPPRTTWGNSGDALRVGAHTAHAGGSPISPPFDCSVCHPKPIDAFAVGHLDAGPAEVSFSGQAVRGTAAAWDRTAGACSNVYCHGATLSGGTHRTPSWTGGSAQATCGSCHGAPPLAPHPAVSGGLAACAACHPETVAADGTVIPPAQGGKHLDGALQVTGGGHPPTWLDRSSPAFHAYSANASLATCQSCHGAALDGVGGSATTSCASCHGAAWKTTCTMCHGGTDNQTGAPPRTTWGNSADATRVGAHTRHLAGSANAPAVACATCHTVPADALAGEHVDGGTAEVTLTGVAAAGGATPTFDRTTVTCSSTYCHGGYSGTYSYTAWDWGADAPIPMSVTYRGSGARPSWTGGPTTCASCHGAPPRNGNWHDPGHGNGGTHALCSRCHPGVDAAGTGFIDASRHLDGAVDVTPVYESDCFNCH